MKKFFNSALDFITNTWNWFDTPAKTFTIICFASLIAYFVCEWRESKQQDSKKANRWGGLSVFFGWLFFDMIFVLIFYGVHMIDPEDSVGTAFFYFVVTMFGVATIYDVMEYWYRVSNDERRKQNNSSIDKIIKGWFATNGSFKEQSLVSYELSLCDYFGRHSASSEESTSEDSPLDWVDIEGVIESAPSVLSMQITGDNGEMFMINFKHMDKEMIGEISIAIGKVEVENVSILTRERNNVYNVFFWVKPID